MNTLGQTMGAASVALDRIVTSRGFRFREGPLDQYHRDDLARSLTVSAEPFAPLLLWRQRGAPDNTPLIVLDGEHRLAAYRMVKWPDKVPALILEGDRRSALAAALSANAMPVKPLSLTERLNAAWRLVREDVTPRYKRNEIARLAKVGIRTVANMRARWAVMQTRETAATGNWKRDQRDRTYLIEGEPMLTDAQRGDAIAGLAARLRDLLDYRKNPDPILRDAQAVDEAIISAMGERRIYEMASFAGGAPYETEDPLRVDLEDGDFGF